MSASDVPSLRIGVNLLWCRPGRVGGAEEYLVHQLLALHRVEPQWHLHLAVPPGFPAAHPELARQFKIAVGGPLTSIVPGRILEEMRWLPGVFTGTDVVHHGNATVPPRSRGSIVLSVQDLQYREYPQYFSAFRLNYLRWMLPRSIRQASVIAVPSEFVRGTVIDAFDVEMERIRVTPPALGPAVPIPPAADVRSRYGLGDRGILVFPAATFPHKRHDFLLDLMAGPLSWYDGVLVLLGGKGRAEKQVSDAIGVRRLEGRVIRVGRVSSADRNGLIAIADALVFPSEYEGFGLPVLEAMALQTPVVCSDRGSLPEVAGTAALVAPLDLDAWAVAIHQALDMRSELVKRGASHAAQFTIEASGRALADAYRQAAAR